MRTLAAIGALTAARVALAQNDAVGWDPREVGWNLTSGSALLALFVTIGAFYGFWRYIAWRIAHTNGGHAIRYWLPTVMVGSFWLTAGATAIEWIPRSAVDFLLGVVCAANLPAFAVGALLSDLPMRLPICLLAVVGTAGGWFTWYGIVRFLERRAMTRHLTTLRIADR